MEVTRKTVKFITGLSGKLTLGEPYEITWLDHFGSSSQTCEEAVKHDPMLLNTTGKLIGITPLYIIFATEYENSTSNNNEYTHIMKKCVTKLRRLK